MPFPSPLRIMSGIYGGSDTLHENGKVMEIVKGCKNRSKPLLYFEYMFDICTGMCSAGVALTSGLDG